MVRNNENCQPGLAFLKAGQRVSMLKPPGFNPKLTTSEGGSPCCDEDRSCSRDRQPGAKFYRQKMSPQIVYVNVLKAVVEVQ